MRKSPIFLVVVLLVCLQLALSSMGLWKLNFDGSASRQKVRVDFGGKLGIVMACKSRTT